MFADDNYEDFVNRPLEPKKPDIYSSLLGSGVLIGIVITLAAQWIWRLL